MAVGLTFPEMNITINSAQPLNGHGRGNDETRDSSLFTGPLKPLIAEIWPGPEEIFPE